MFWSIVLSSFILMVAIIAIGQGTYELINRRKSAPTSTQDEEE